jgi:hypothetical protein
MCGFMYTAMVRYDADMVAVWHQCNRTITNTRSF